MNLALYNLKAEEFNGPVTLVTPCHLIVPFARHAAVGSGSDRRRSLLRRRQTRDYRCIRGQQETLPQLAEIGYTPKTSLSSPLSIIVLASFNFA